MPLKETVYEFFKTSQYIRLGQRVLNTQVLCKMALYVGCTTYPSVQYFYLHFFKLINQILIYKKKK